MRDNRTKPVMSVTGEVHQQTLDTIGAGPAERGGAAGADLHRPEEVITRFAFDAAAVTSGSTYTPDTKSLNAILQQKWRPQGIELIGFFHSHPRGATHPSGGDIRYARRILSAMPEVPHLWLPIFIVLDQSVKVLPYLVERDGSEVVVKEAELKIVDRAAPSLVESEADIWKGPFGGGELDSDTFSRVAGSYDLDRMKHSRVVAVGVGGAADYLESLARAGTGEFVLIDPDKVSLANLATQQVYRRDLDRPKVDCVRDRILDINPNALVMTVGRALDDLQDADFRKLLFQPWTPCDAPVVTLLCGLTDSFEAQARVNRLGLHFGVPTLCAQVYQEGRGAEVTFVVPGITAACHRCMLDSRYEAYEKGFRNNVTSHGTPIFSTTRLNSVKGFVSLAILHQPVQGVPVNKAGQRWQQLLVRIRGRNLVQVRMDPDIARSLGLRVFERVLGRDDGGCVVFDETLWLPQLPNHPVHGFKACPDCGGTGNLLDVRGTFRDTRIARRSV